LSGFRRDGREHLAATRVNRSPLRRHRRPHEKAWKRGALLFPMAGAAVVGLLLLVVADHGLGECIGLLFEVAASRPRRKGLNGNFYALAQLAGDAPVPFLVIDESVDKPAPSLLKVRRRLPLVTPSRHRVRDVGFRSRRDDAA